MASLPRDTKRNTDDKRAHEEELAAIREERQGNTGNGHEIDRHPHVFDDVREIEAGDPEHAQAGEGIGRLARDAQQAEQHPGEQREPDQHADEPQLLADDREYEVGMLGWEKRQAFLRALREPLPEEAA